LINNSSLLFINLFSNGRDNQLYATDWVGASIWLIGFAIEVIADW